MNHFPAGSSTREPGTGPMSGVWPGARLLTPGGKSTAPAFSSTRLPHALMRTAQQQQGRPRRHDGLSGAGSGKSGQSRMNRPTDGSSKGWSLLYTLGCLAKPQPAVSQPVCLCVVNSTRTSAHAADGAVMLKQAFSAGKLHGGQGGSGASPVQVRRPA
jgi:hypothetical protein